MDIWLWEIIKAIGRFFVHPMFYIFLLSSFLVGYWRVKRERKDFAVKIHDVWYELRTSLLSSLSLGILLSIITIGAGIVLSKASLLVIAAWTIFFALFMQYRYVSAAYSFGIAILYFTFFSKVHTGVQLVDTWIGDEQGTSLQALAILMSLLLLVEGRLIIKNAAQTSTPRLLKGKRGFHIGMHRAKRLWLLPVFIFIPGDAITKLFDWWPIVSIGSHTFSLFLVPFAVGFSKAIRGALPSTSISYTGRRIVGLSILVLALAIISHWLPGVAVAAAGVAILGRFTIAIRDRIEDAKQPPYFSIQENGLMILDTLPESPAEEMGLKPGEIIVKVNGIVPKTLKDFYQALQRNAAGAFCKLDVIDTNGELRFVQRAMFAGEHHELGIIFVQRDYDLDTEVV
ncbi:PDZ domain-containing protein [Microbacteriaceae bacterium 4G12]